MTDSIAFTYKRAKQSVINIFFLLQLALVFGCFFSIIGTLIAAILAEKLFAQELPPYSFLFVFVVLTIGYLFSGYWRRLNTISFEDDVLSWQSGWKKAQSIRHDEIQSAKINKGSLVINDNIKIFLGSLPQKTHIEFTSILPSWLPETALSKEWKIYLDGKKQLQYEWKGKGAFSKSASTDKEKAIRIRKVAITGLIIFVGLVLWLTTIGPFREVDTPIILLGIVLFYVSIVVWATTTLKRFQVDEQGITYQQARKELFWRWEDIEVIAFQINLERLLIWQGPRYKSYSYKRINAEDMNIVANTIFQQAMIRNIPVTWV